MRRRRTRACFALALLVGCLAGSRPAAAVYSCGGVQDTCSCGASNFCICCSNATYGTNHGNCVWWGWHSACCHWGIGLQWCTNAGTWDNYAVSYGYHVSKTPCASTVFVCEAYTSLCGSGGYGHVGWVTAAYADGSIDVTEQGCNSFWGVHSRHFNAQWASPAMDYIYRPGVTSCGSHACTPGQTQTQACGNCGRRTRTCTSSYQWGSWSSCTGQGPCSPGATQTQDCCDCGTHTRTCQNNCEWSAWGACSGPDPPGNPTCDTGEPGICADGHIRCVQGCLTCVRDTEPTDELCDDVDNDCDGEVDDGYPTEMGTPPPAFAARVVDWSAPQRLAPGASGSAWVVVENVGLEIWPVNEVGLAALAPRAGTPSALWDPDAWPAFDVAARISAEVRPGDLVLVPFSIRLPEDATAEITESFQLLDPTGELVRCPEPAISLTVGPIPPSLTPEADAPDERPATDVDPAAAMQAASGCGCSSGSGETPALPWLLALLGLLLRGFGRSGKPPRRGLGT